MCREQVDATTASLSENGIEREISPLKKLPRVNNVLNLSFAFGGGEGEIKGDYSGIEEAVESLTGE